jgi:hypothetical protein
VVVTLVHATIHKLLTQLKFLLSLTYLLVIAILWPTLWVQDPFQLQLMLNLGNSILVEFSAIALLVWTTELHWSEQAKQDNIGKLRTLGDPVGEKMDLLD